MTMSTYASSSNASMEDVTATSAALAPPAAAREQQRDRQSCYNLYSADTNGDVFLVQFPVASSSSSSSSSVPSSSAATYEPVPIRGGRKKASSSERAAQKLAYGQLADGQRVLAIARRDATIDVVSVSSSTEEGESEAETVKVVEEGQVGARLLVTLNEPRMKPGLQRWVGLAVHSRGIVACASSGAFTFFPLASSYSKEEEEEEEEEAEKVVGQGVELAEAEVVRLELPGPLQQLVFHREGASEDPTHFAYGGEEVPLSLWDLNKALSEAPGPENVDGQHGGSEAAGEVVAEDAQAKVAGENAKARKRKRQAEARQKNKELVWGEIWRAKNLPNDALSLPQRANIVCLDFVRGIDEEDEDDLSEGKRQQATAADAIPAKLHVVVGTRTGLVRVYHPSSGVRKHTSEHHIFPDASPVKTMTSGCSPGEIFVSDTSGKLFAVEWSRGKTLYSYKDITGAISGLVPLPAPQAAEPKSGAKGETHASLPLLASTSLDRMVRLHSTVPPPVAQVKANGKEPVKRPAVSNKRGQVIASVFTGGPAAVACVWDGKVPTIEESAEDNLRAGKGNGEGAESEEEDDDEDEIWEEMDQVGTKMRKGNSGGGKAAEEEEEEDEDQEAKKEQRAKRRR
ncbi:hypothetical protein FA10DRAFT_32442 [Acaromyces ingoldii]|uniref:Ribosome biogenesis protein NSA1 n=1 Tax=Acaromyces ingoldii TaxID=215250 RepID=A0A316YXA2_9BASI|nr:hypothetical protein FA10DRAFT_32442 [Acaromyces ingoldii]PWN93821.1 hypothetical protein FA10DRAFT_32442 [Acaromyces ingoldii]